MALKAYRFVGLNRDVYLPDDIEVVIDIVPASMIGWVRSGTRNAPDYSTWHDTGNPGATAIHEKNYLHGGPRDQYGNRYQVGYNFAVDDRRIVQITPLDEDTWAAGTPDGNHTSWHVEQCFGGSIDFDRSTRNCAALHGGLIAAMPGWELAPSLVQHNVWYGKDCPRQLRQRGQWAAAVAQAAAFFAVARAAAGGATVTPKPKPPTPEPQPEPQPDRTFTARYRIPIRQAPGFNGRVLKELAEGTVGTIIDGPKRMDGIDWYDVRIAGFGTGWVPASIVRTLDIKG